MSEVIREIEKGYVEKAGAVPDFGAGDTLRVHIQVVEGERKRIQVFEGFCIARRNAGWNSSFTMRKLSFGQGVERIFSLYSPRIEKIEVSRRGDVRRAKLFYLRGRTGKKARIAERLVKKGQGVSRKSGGKKATSTKMDAAPDSIRKTPVVEEKTGAPPLSS